MGDLKNYTLECRLNGSLRTLLATGANIKGAGNITSPVTVFFSFKVKIIIFSPDLVFTIHVSYNLILNKNKSIFTFRKFYSY